MSTEERRAAYACESLVNNQGLYYLTVAFASGGHVPQDDASQGHRLWATIEEARKAAIQANTVAFGIGEMEAFEIVTTSMFGSLA